MEMYLDLGFGGDHLIHVNAAGHPQDYGQHRPNIGGSHENRQ